MAFVSPDAILGIANGFMAAKNLMVANELGLFEALAAGPASLDQLVQRTDVPERSVRILANAMVAIGMLELENDTYANSAVAQTYLSGQGPGDMRPMLRFMHHITYPQWGTLEQAARTGIPASSTGTFEGEQRRIYSEGMESITRGSARALVAVYDFSRHQRVLDLGGGIGSFLAEILRHQPQLEATLFERSTVVELARAYFDQHEQTRHAKTIAGDILNDTLPTDHDAIIVSNVIHHFSPEQTRDLFERIRARAAANARLLLIDFWTDPTHTQPAFAALTAAQFLISSAGGGMYSVEEVQTWLAQTGWQFVQHTPINGASSLIVAQQD